MLTVLALATVASVAPAGSSLVTVESPIELTLTPGESEELEIDVTVADGFHVQANPAANEFLIPLELELESDEGLELGEIRYPPAKAFRIAGTEEDLLTYDGTFVVTIFIRAPWSAEGDTVHARGRFRYQACDERSCRPPATTDFALKARIKAPDPSPRGAGTAERAG